LNNKTLHKITVVIFRKLCTWNCASYTLYCFWKNGQSVYEDENVETCGSSLLVVCIFLRYCCQYFTTKRGSTP